LPGGRDDLVELTCRRWDRIRQGDLIVHESRKLEQRDIQLVDSIPVTVPERVIIDLASLRPIPSYLEIVVQSARRKRLITYESTRTMFERHARRGLRGVKALRSVLDEWNPQSRATESEMETMLLQALRDHHLPEPTVQYAALDARGGLVARADVAFPAHRIVVEYDSMQEHSDEFQLARDARRRNALQALGYSVLSVRHADLAAGGSLICAEISAIIRRTA
jgi:very-short-patch-repair endonuclease